MVNLERSAMILLISAMGFGCVTEDTYKAQLAKYDTLVAQHDAQQKELDSARKRVAELEAQLKSMGMELGAAKSDDEALKSYQKRAEMLERMKERLANLRSKLQKLTDLGLDVTIRHNRMVISLPGDVLFESGKVDLRDEGRSALEQVAAVIRADKSLADRYYQVAGHTDNQPLGGDAKKRYQDNWGLSLMRAREVLVFLVTPTNSRKGGGGLDSDRWSASGYGWTDPVANNTGDKGRSKNRRVELIVLPDVEEMLDLRSLL